MRALAAAGALLAGLALPLHAQAEGSLPASAGPGYVSADEVRQGGPIHGIIVSDANHPFDVGMLDLNRLADDGINQVTFYLTWYFGNTTDAAILPGPFTPSDSEVATAIQAAHQAGMTVQIDPILWSGPTSTTGYHWRGLLDPTDQDAFWSAYDDLILHYAQLAQDNDVEVYAIGSELRALEPYVDRWRQLAAAVRQVYSGKLTYMALTWSVKKVEFWRSVDYIGTSPYYWLSGDMMPSYQELRDAWGPFFRPLRRLSKRTGRPVLFNEIGYLSAQKTTADPWRAKTTYPASQKLQARAYAALLDAAADQRWLAGIVFYKWTEPGLPTDTSYSPRDKRAECAMAVRWAPPEVARLRNGQPMGCFGSVLAASAGIP